MPIANLADLFVATSEYMGRADFAHLFPRFVAMAELDIERKARFSDQHKTAVLTPVSRRATLPVDFLVVKSVRETTSPGQHLNALSAHLDVDPVEMEPPGYRIEAGEIVILGDVSGTIRLDYFARMPRLTGAAPTNWLLSKAPDALLMGTVTQAMVWAGDQRGDLARAGFETALADAMRLDRAGRLTNAVITTAGGLP